MLKVNRASTLAIFAVCQVMLAQGHPVLRHVRDVASLTNAQAAAGIPVDIVATVTAVQPQDANLFLEEDGVGVYADFGKVMGLKAGDLVHVVGKTAPSFHPQIEPTEVTFLSHGKLPRPVVAKQEDLIEAKLDSTLVTVSGHVLSATLDDEKPIPGLRFQMQIADGIVEGVIIDSGGLHEDDLVDADVTVTGVAGGAFDSKLQMAGIWLDVQDATLVHIDRKPASNPWAQPSVPIDQVIYAYRHGSTSRRVRVAGVLTYYEPGTVAVVEANGLSILIGTGTTTTLTPGTVVEVTGFPEVTDDSMWLNHAQIRSMAKVAPIAPKPVKFEEASQGKDAYDLISMEGTVVAEVRDARVDLFVLESDGHLYAATLRHLGTDAEQKPSTVWVPKVGSRVRVSGVCFVDVGNHWRDRLWFTLRMRDFSDLVLVSPPPFWTLQRLMITVTVLLVAVLFAVAWVWALRRRVRQQTVVLARKSKEEGQRERRMTTAERQRSRVLEMISGTATLEEIKAAILEMISARLEGAECWFELMGEGHADARAEGIVAVPVLARDGMVLGRLLAKPSQFLPMEVDVPATLNVGARLAGLAMDTRRLLEDLRQRSETDLLTGIANRFVMERELEEMLVKANHQGTTFGLIYVDLDYFKQVNDQYGHRTGDLYLQAVTQRMKAQLRGGDLLARIGGDEFVALTPVLHTRKDAEEIADRLKHCFDDPFEIEGAVIRGSASVGLAVYPEDGVSKEALQRAADTAMYAGKQERRSARVYSIRDAGRR